MFTSQTSVEELVLKTAAFRQAAGLPITSAVPQQPSSDGQNNGETSCSAGNYLPTAAADAASLPFTFTVPSRALNLFPTTPQTSAEHFRKQKAIPSPFPPDNRRNANTSQQQQQQQQQQQEENQRERVHFAARNALRDALQRHEDALRAWADAPMAQIPSTQPALLLPRPAPASAALRHAELNSAGGAGAKNSLPPSRIASPPYTTVMEGNREGVASAMRRVTASMVQPHCRVLARDSMAKIGLPQPPPQARATPTKVVSSSVRQTSVLKGSPSQEHTSASPNETMASTGCSTSEHAVKKEKKGSLHVTPDISRIEDGYVASRSSSCVTAPEHPTPARTMRSETTAAAADSVVSACEVKSPLAPYQLPLRMRWDARPSAPATSSHSRVQKWEDGNEAHDRADPERENDAWHTFLRDQAARYAQWRSRQAIILNQLAPDVFHRTLPPYAAADATPRVMDGDLRRCATTVGRYQHDSGVVYM